MADANEDLEDYHEEEESLKHIEGAEQKKYF